jgi:hypothetical protein
MKDAPEHPTPFDMIIENADGEKIRFYLNIRIFSLIMPFWMSLILLQMPLRKIKM